MKLILAFLLASQISGLHGSPQLPPFSAPAVWGARGWAELLVWICLLQEWVGGCLMLEEITCWSRETKGVERLGEKEKGRYTETLSSLIFQKPIWFSVTLIVLLLALPTLPSPWNAICYHLKIVCFSSKDDDTIKTFWFCLFLFFICCNQKSFILTSQHSKCLKNTYMIKYGTSLICKFSETSVNGLLFPLNVCYGPRPEV